MDLKNDSEFIDAQACYQFKSNIQSFITYYIPLIIVIGLVGNILSALTFMTTKLRQLPSSYYLTALALADSGMLLCHLILITGGVHALRTVPFLCQLTLYAGGVFSFLSVWYVVGFTLERYIAVRYPLRRLKWCTVRRARCSVIGIASFACLFNAHILVSTRPTVDTQNRTECNVNEAFMEVANTMNHVDTVLTFIIPLILIGVWNTAVGITLCLKAKREIANMISSKRRRPYNNCPSTADEGVVNGLLLPAFVGETLLGGELRLHVRRKLADDRRMTCMLLIVSLVFLIMNFPDHVIRMVIYGLYRTRKWDTMPSSRQCWITSAQQVTMILFHTNFAINFFLYSLVGANFREHLRKMLSRFIT